MNKQELIEQIAIQTAGSIHLASIYLFMNMAESLTPPSEESIADEVVAFAEVLAQKLTEKREKLDSETKIDFDNTEEAKKNN